MFFRPGCCRIPLREKWPSRRPRALGLLGWSWGWGFDVWRYIPENWRLENPQNEGTLETRGFLKKQAMFGIYVRFLGCMWPSWLVVFFFEELQYRGIMMNYRAQYVLVPKREPQFEGIVPENVPVSEEHGFELPLKASQMSTVLMFGVLLFQLSTWWRLQLISDFIFKESLIDDPFFWSNVSCCF